MGANEIRLVRWVKRNESYWACVDARSGGTLGDVKCADGWWRGCWHATSARSPPMTIRHAVAWVDQHLRRAKCEVRGRVPR